MSQEFSDTQRTHLKARLNTIAAEKVSAKRAELFGANGSIHTVTWGEMFAAIQAGEVTLNEGEEGNTNAYLLPNQVQWPARKAKVQALADYTAKVEAESQAIYDKFVFNNIDGVTDALAEFAK